MASPVFRQKWKRAGGRVVPSRHYYACVYVVGEGGRRRRVRVKLAETKVASLALYEKHMAGEVAEQARSEGGHFKTYADQQKRPVREHVEDYISELEGNDDTRGYVRRTQSRVMRVLEGCGFEMVGQVKPGPVLEYLKRLQTRGGLSTTTRNHYLRAIKSFTAWLVRDGRAGENRLGHLSALNPNADRRHERRALTADEARDLVAAAERGETVLGVSGPLRALCYRLALTTGLRRNEIRSLTWGSFDLGGNPTVTVEAGYSKHRRRDVLPLAADMAQALRRWRLQHGLDDPVFPLPHRTAEMLRVDLEGAGIAYRDSSGRVVDFHALRHTFITNLVRGGVHPKVAQTLARHSTIGLTMDHYAHLEALEQRSALDVLPDLGTMGGGEEVKATGTDE